ATISSMATHFELLLAGIVAGPEQSIGELELLTAGEKRELLREWNHTESDYTRAKCVHQLFEEQAARTPAAIAVGCKGQILSYGELEQRANQLARHLRALGAGAGIRVGICMERSLEMVVGLLGILKAGAA